MMKMVSRRVALLVVLLFSVSTAHAQSHNLFFQPPTYFGTGQIVTADFNRDGKADLVSADGTVLLGNGDGTFTTGTALPLQGRFIATADFNGDGKPDVVLTDFSSTNVYVFLGNGDGTFQAPVTTNAGTPLGPTVVADVNGDGKPDVLGAISGGMFLVLLGKGDGTFAPGVTHPALSSLFTVGDFNGDGKLDIVFAAGSGTGTPGTVGVLFGNGDGTFQTAITSTGPSDASAMVAADFNGDGKLDLAISQSGYATPTNETYILLGNGNGTFQAPSSPLPAIGALAAVDLNGDGKPDLVVAADPFVKVFLGSGSGTFTLKDTYLEGLLLAGMSQTLAIADFNGDGKPDVAADDTILLGNGDGSLQGNTAIPGLGDRGVTGDFNRDGRADIAIFSNNLDVLLGDGTGKFSLAHTYALPLPFDAVTTTDLRGAGKLDLVATSHDPTTQDWILNVILGNGDGSFGSPTAFPQGVVGPVTSLAFADFNGDHKLDLAVISGGQLTVFLGNGDGTFASPMSFFAGSVPTSLVTADFNNDGIVDVAVSSSAGTGILLGKGDGTFQPATFPLSGVGTVAAVDLNGDGNVDLIAFDEVLLGNGNGTFKAPLPVKQPIGGNVSLVDFDGDGKLDLVSTDGAASGGVLVSLGHGDGTFGDPITIQPHDSKIVYRRTADGFILVADFNGDGRPDLAIDVDSGVVTLLNTSAPPAPDFLISASVLSPATVAPGSSATSTVTVTSVGGFKGAVALSCTGLPSGANCSFSPSSVPSASGTASLTMSTAASTPQGTYPVLIVGTSTALIHECVITLTVATSAGATTASLAPQTLTFAERATGTTSAAQSVTLTNTGSAQLTISGISITGANKGDFAQTNNCGSSLAASAACQISVTFTPTGMGARSAAISVSDNATGSPQMVALAGTGPDFSMGASGAASATVTAGHTASYTISLAPGGGFNQTVTLACTGAPAMSTCTVSPTSVSLSGSSAATATVTVATTAHGLLLPVGVANPRTDYRLAPLLLAVLGVMIILCLRLWQRERRFRWVPVLTVLILLCLGVTVTSCGGGGGGGGSPGGARSGGTQAGTYTLTVSASATSGSTMLTHSTNLTLVVQ
jgi:VCBS repeat protein/centrosomal CEP192-like protein